jgi:hypothetical protein
MRERRKYVVLEVWRSAFGESSYDVKNDPQVDTNTKPQPHSPPDSPPSPQFRFNDLTNAQRSTSSHMLAPSPNACTIGPKWTPTPSPNPTLRPIPRLVLSSALAT